MGLRMNLRFLLIALIASLVLASCNLPGASTPLGRPAESTQDGGPLGSQANPFVLAIPPGASEEAGQSAARIAEELSRLVGLTVVAREFKSYNAIVDGFAAGEVHIAWLPPLAYLLAHDNGDANAAIENVVKGRELSAAQFLVSAARISGANGFRTYFDPASGENMVEASVALAQFADKRPCWTDPYAAVGYVLPVQILNNNGIAARAGAFLQGDSTVVTTLYRDTRGELCDFGATSVDAREAVISDMPDVMDKVLVVWRSPPVIPNDTLAYASVMPEDVRIHMTAALLAIAASPNGLSDLRVAYQVDTLKMIDDTFFNDLRALLVFPYTELRKFIH